MKQLDEIIFDAILADAKLKEAVGGRVKSTCFEVPPEKQDNTPVPYIIVADDGLKNNQTTKDNVWESSEDAVLATVEVAAKSPKAVKELICKVRKAVQNYIVSMYEEGNAIPELQSLTSDGIDWDWTKPCYYQRLTYQCIINTDIDGE